MYFAIRHQHSSSVIEHGHGQTTNLKSTQFGFANNQRLPTPFGYPVGPPSLMGQHPMNIAPPLARNSLQTHFEQSAVFMVKPTSKGKLPNGILPDPNWQDIRQNSGDVTQDPNMTSVGTSLPDCHNMVTANTGHLLLPPPVQERPITDLQLGPVEKAVLHQAMYNQSKKQTPAMRRCDDCNVIFNSQMQAEMHYKGKKHAKVMYLKRCRETKHSPVKIRDSTLAEIEKSLRRSTTPPDDSRPEVPLQVNTYQPNFCHINTNIALTHSAKMNEPFFNAPKDITENSEELIKIDNFDHSITNADFPVVHQDTLIGPVITSNSEVVSNSESNLKTDTETESELNTELPQREPVILPDPLPRYIKKIEKPAVLKESLRCNVCDIYVNSENQMKQHVNSLRHKNIEQGIPTPPKPNKEDKPKARAEQFRCEVCRVTLNSDIQLLQHLSSQRHKNMLEGKPPKPRWTPYERTQHALLRSASQLRLSLKTIPSTASPLLIPQPNLPIAAQPSLHQSLLAPTPPAHLKQTAFITPDGSILQTREIVYVGAGGQAFTAPFQPAQLPTGQMIQPTQFQTLPTELQSLINAQCFDPRKLGLEWNV